jgi:hypothetical protein
MTIGTTISEVRGRQILDDIKRLYKDADISPRVPKHYPNLEYIRREWNVVPAKFKMSDKGQELQTEIEELGKMIDMEKLQSKKWDEISSQEIKNTFGGIMDENTLTGKVIKALTP